MLRYAMVASASLALASMANAADWNLPSGYPDQNYHTQNLNWFAGQVREATGGKLNIAVHSNGSLVRLPEIKRAVQSGQVQIGEVLISNYGNEDALFEADMVPFLARGIVEAKKLYALQRPMLEERLAAQNLVLLYSVCWPGNGVFSARELPTLKSMKGMKFRAYNAITERMAEKLGAQPVTIQVPELAQAFYTGLAEVMVAAAPVVQNAKGWEFGKYFYDTLAFLPRNAVIANRRTWEALPEETRRKVLDIAKAAEDRGWDLCAESQTKSARVLADNGLKVVEPDEAMMKEFAETMVPIINEWEARAGKDGTRLRKGLGK
ncbi:MAG: TRAP transporter substrate-binding protein [Hyphomicrobiaceae bacterium]|nr:TRAP transporter substrate-binding protein [Hyphomicrobiaceae bacterium]